MQFLAVPPNKSVAQLKRNMTWVGSFTPRHLTRSRPR